MTDQELLHLFLHYQPKRQRAFTALVTRHVHWMHAAAIRQVGDPHAAEDVVQAAFIVLANKAASLPENVRLTPWLASVVRLAAKRRQRDIARQRHHEMQVQINATPREAPSAADQAAWNEIAPQLDAAVGRLRKLDREAILLRFYRQLTFAEVGATMGLSEDAAKKRVARALRKLRPMLARQGGLAGIGVAGLAAILMTHTTATAAPAGLIGTATTIGLSGASSGILAGVSGTVASGVLTALNCTYFKIAACVALLLLLTTIAGVQFVEMVHEFPASKTNVKPPSHTPEPTSAFGLTTPLSDLYYAARFSAGS